MLFLFCLFFFNGGLGNYCYFYFVYFFSTGDLVSYIGFDFLLKTCGIWVHLSLGQIVFEGKRAWNSNFNGGIGKRAWNKGFTGNILVGAFCQNIFYLEYLDIWYINVLLGFVDYDLPHVISNININSKTNYWMFGWKLVASESDIQNH